MINTSDSYTDYVHICKMLIFEPRRINGGRANGVLDPYSQDTTLNIDAIDDDVRVDFKTITPITDFEKYNEILWQDENVFFTYNGNSLYDSDEDNYAFQHFDDYTIISVAKVSIFICLIEYISSKRWILILSISLFDIVGLAPRE